MKLLLLLSFFVVVISGDKEYVEPEYYSMQSLEYHAQNANDDAAKSREHLWRLFGEFLDQDFNLNRTQLFGYIEKSLKKHHNEEIEDELNDELSVEFDAYFKKVYGKDALEEFLKRVAVEINPKMDELEMLFKLEFNRWSFIFKDQGLITESTLTQKQFYSFIYLNEFEAIRLNDAKFVFDFYDLNHDLLIDYDEYLKALEVNSGFLLIEDHDEIINKNESKFTSKIDVNSDNRVNLSEFADWNVPSLAHSTRKQVNEIFNKCDSNHDNLLNKSEIERNFELFKLYEFTNFGEDFIQKVSSTHEEF